MNTPTPSKIKNPDQKKKAHIFLGTCYHILQSIIHQAGYIFE